MGSRRVMTRSYSADGRFGCHNGDDVSTSGRPGGPSYLSNVRPENRSTLCSVMALLTEETQPTFETTLKSKAVSDNCNVKFTCVVTGYPIPEITWYKDDMQLDRYCGLPKYQIFRNGQNHSLHIYNCTVDDAAIYQASASNSKGIVSCSGVLEVGVMSEYKIHQRYFDKLKQKAESRRRELERKENQGPGWQGDPRNVSPDRSQRKRRSSTGPQLGGPAPHVRLQDAGPEDIREAPKAAAEAGPRLRGSAAGPAAAVEAAAEGEKPALTPRPGTADPVVNGKAADENASNGLMYMYDSAQKAFTARQPKTPFTKKIKISNGAESAKVETPAEKAFGNEEASVAPAPPAGSLFDPQGPFPELMEVESAAQAPTSHSDPAERRRSALTEAVNETPSEEEKMCFDGNVEVFSQKEKPVPTGSSSMNNSHAPLLSHSPKNRPTSQTERKQDDGIRERLGDGDREETFDLLLPKPHATSIELLAGHAATPQRPPGGMEQGDTTRTRRKEDAAAMAADEESTESETQLQIPNDTSRMCEAVNAAAESTAAGRRPPSPPASRPHRALGPAAESGDAFPRRLRDQTRGKESEKGRSRGPKRNAPVPQPPHPPQPAAVTQARARRGRSNAAVDLGAPPPTRSEPDTRARRRTPSEEEAPADGGESPALHGPALAMSGDGTRGTWDHSGGSDESRTALFTDPQTFPRESGSDGESASGCSVSPAIEPSQVELAVKTVEGLETAVDKKSKGHEGGKVQVRGAGLAPDERKAEMDTEAVPLEGTGNDERQKERFEDVVRTESEKEPAREGEGETRPTSPKPDVTFGTFPGTEDPENVTTSISQQQIKGFKEVPKSAFKVVSVAELVRAQIEALDVTISNSLNCDSSISVGGPQVPTATEIETDNEKRPELGKPVRELELERKRTALGRKAETNLSVSSVPNSKKKHPECRHRINTTEREPTPSLNPTSSAEDVIPPISGKDTGNFLGTVKPSGGMESHGAVDTGQESGTSATLTIKEDPKTIQLELCSNTTNSNVQSPNPRVIITEENKESLSSPETGMDSLASFCAKVTREDTTMSTVEHDDAKYIPGTDPGVEPNLAPEMKPSGETHLNGTPTLSMACLEELIKPAPSSSGGEGNTPPVVPQNNFSTVEESPAALPNQEAPADDASSPILSATPQELASGARRKIFTSRPKTEDGPAPNAPETQPQKEEAPPKPSRLSPGPGTPSGPPGPTQSSPSLQPRSQRRSPLPSRKTVPAPETKEPARSTQTPRSEDGKPLEKDKSNPFKAPQVIRKIRGESFSDTSGHLKLWCQFFNVLSDSTIRWFRDQVEIAEVKRRGGDETQVNLAIVQASSRDCGLYGCRITNEHGTDSTDFLLSMETLAGMFLREDVGAGEEIEMTPFLLTKGLADAGVWGSKFFGRVVMHESRIGTGRSHKTRRAKVVYGLEPVFESGTACVVKVRDPIWYGGKGEGHLVERNLDMSRQKCRIQNLAREYCKIFSAEARVIENFGPSLEIIPVYLMYRPANTVPYATVEADLDGVYLKYSQLTDADGLVVRAGSQVEQRCCALQHWIHQWTSGNLLLTQLEGVENKLTNVGISVKSSGYQGLSTLGNPRVFEQFLSQHQCNYYCGLLGLRSLKTTDSLQAPSKSRGSKSPSLQRKMAAGSHSPQTTRKAAVSPRPPRRSPESEQDGARDPMKQKAAAAVPTSPR